MFTGTVLDITDHPAGPVPVETGQGDFGNRIASAKRMSDPMPHLFLSFRFVRIRVGEVLSGVNPGQKEIEIATGLGGGDCGYAFRIGVDYVVYAYKDAEGRLATGICSRTRPLAQATEDIEYLRAMSSAPETGEIRVRTGLPGASGKPGVTIIAERAGSRYTSLTNAAGEAVFTGLAPGDYNTRRIGWRLAGRSQGAVTRKRLPGPDPISNFTDQRPCDDEEWPASGASRGTPPVHTGHSGGWSDDRFGRSL